MVTKVLFNGTSLHKGGALQVSTSVILQACRNPCDIEWFFALSRKNFDELEEFDVALPREKLVVFEKSPARSRKARSRLRHLEADIQPDCVFTLFGPAYVKFQALHLLGCANPWVIHPTWAAYRLLGSPLKAARNLLVVSYLSHWFVQANAWVTQTEIARQGMHKRLRLPLEKIYVTPNVCDKHYLDSQGVRPYPSSGSKVRLLCFSAAYPHKNLIIVPRVAKRLSTLNPMLDFEFVLTLPSDSALCTKIMSLAKSLEVARFINNIGPVPLTDGPDLYQTCDICFLPTLLEVFSATYPEAMAMGTPIVTTDLDFARDVCRDAALYYDYWDPNAAAERILELIRDKDLWDSQIQRGKAVLKELPGPHERYEQYVAGIRKLVEENGG